MKPIIRKALLISIIWTCLAGAVIASEPLKVVTTFSILEDVIGEIGKDRISLVSLVGRESDTHHYEPTPKDAALLAKSDVLISNGLGFDDWVERLATASGFQGTSLALGIDAPALTATDDTSSRDPHLWQDVSNVRRYVTKISALLAKTDQKNADFYNANAKAYDLRLAALDQWVKGQFAILPPERRAVVSSHDAFQYFAKAYGIEFQAPLGIHNDAEPNAKHITVLIKQIRADKIKALFLENNLNSKLLAQISAETGVAIGGALYSDTLSSAEGPAPNYIAMIRHNVTSILEALR